MRLYRLVRQKYSSKLSGKGAAKMGGRWNSAGTEVVYLSASRALAMAETLVHLTPAEFPPDYMMLTIELPDDVPIMMVDEELLPAGWNNYLHYDRETQKMGDAFVKENEYLLMRVPSSVVKGEWNYMMNPYHPEFSRVKIIQRDPFSFDPRLGSV